jgi:predicted nucleic-acid-binding protein
MIGLDTNILLRAATNDDPVRSPPARAIIAALTPQRPAVINSVVLVEFAWTLRTGYGHSRTDILAAIETMMRSACYLMPDRDAVNTALSRCHKDRLDFADALIGSLNAHAGSKKTLTFDEKCASSTGFEAA